MHTEKNQNRVPKNRGAMIEMSKWEPIIENINHVHFNTWPVVYHHQSDPKGKPRFHEILTFFIDYHSDGGNLKSSV